MELLGMIADFLGSVPDGVRMDVVFDTPWGLAYRFAVRMAGGHVFEDGSVALD